jgi:hypothetical protein
VGAASLVELHADLPIAGSQRPCLSGLMRFLATIGIFSEAEDDTAATASTGDQRRYRIATASRLLVDDDSGDTCLSPFLSVCIPHAPYLFTASLHLPEWLETEDRVATPFMMAHGVDLWSMLGHDAEVGTVFNAGMGADSRFVAQIVLHEFGMVFAGWSPWWTSAVGTTKRWRGPSPRRSQIYGAQCWSFHTLSMAPNRRLLPVVVVVAAMLSSLQGT